MSAMAESGSLLLADSHAVHEAKTQQMEGAADLSANVLRTISMDYSHRHLDVDQSSTIAL